MVQSPRAVCAAIDGALKLWDVPRLVAAETIRYAKKTSRLLVPASGLMPSLMRPSQQRLTHQGQQKPADSGRWKRVPQSCGWAVLRAVDRAHLLWPQGLPLPRDSRPARGQHEQPSMAQRTSGGFHEMQ